LGQKGRGNEVNTDLTHEEMEIVGKLRDNHLSYQEAALAVIMLTRGLARSEKDLIDIVDVHPGLDNKQITQQVIHKLQNTGWLITSTSYNRKIIKAAPDLEQKIADSIQDPSALQRLMQSSARAMQTLPPNIKVLGQMRQESVFGTFLDLLNNAHSEICLPMLLTPPYDSTVTILQERAHKGVHVRILLASPKVAKHIRGEVVGDKAQKIIKDWKNAAHGYAKMEIRITHRIEDMCHMATSWTLDRRLLRYDLYFPWQEGSLDGYMMEFDSRTGSELNIVSLFQACFDEAWNQAQPLNIWGIWWWLRKNWQWGAFFITALIAISFGTSIWRDIIGSVSATFLFNALVSSLPTIKTAIRKLVS
jgi:hypothetical protein